MAGFPFVAAGRNVLAFLLALILFLADTFSRAINILVPTNRAAPEHPATDTPENQDEDSDMAPPTTTAKPAKPGAPVIVPALPILPIRPRVAKEEGAAEGPKHSTTKDSVTKDAKDSDIALATKNGDEPTGKITEPKPDSAAAPKDEPKPVFGPPLPPHMIRSIPQVPVVNGSIPVYGEDADKSIHAGFMREALDMVRKFASLFFID